MTSLKIQRALTCVKDRPFDAAYWDPGTLPRRGNPPLRRDERLPMASPSTFRSSWAGKGGVVSRPFFCDDRPRQSCFPLGPTNKRRIRQRLRRMGLTSRVRTERGPSCLQQGGTHATHRSFGNPISRFRARRLPRGPAKSFRNNFQSGRRSRATSKLQGRGCS